MSQLWGETVASRTSALFAVGIGNLCSEKDGTRGSLLGWAVKYCPGELSFLPNMPEFHWDLNHITSLTFLTGDASVFFNFWISYLSPSVWLVEMKWGMLGVSNGDQETLHRWGEMWCNKTPGSLRKSNYKLLKWVSPVDMNISVPQASICRMDLRKFPHLIEHLGEQGALFLRKCSYAEKW